MKGLTNTYEIFSRIDPAERLPRPTDSMQVCMTIVRGASVGSLVTSLLKKSTFVTYQKCCVTPHGDGFAPGQFN